jgi:hypothetical protein
MRCSSEKSSGIKTSVGLVSFTNHSAPFSGAVFVVVVMALSFFVVLLLTEKGAVK